MSSIRKEWECTDTGNAERFISQWKGKLLYLTEHRTWITWDGRRWVPDHCILSKAEETAKSIFVEASESQNRVELGKWAVASQHTGRLKSMLERSQDAMRVSVVEFDKKPYLLNCQNCVIDLRTKEAWHHDPEQRFLQIANANYDPKAGCSLWRQHIANVHENDQELITWLQLMYGYSATGFTKDHHFFILYGNGRNGKDTEAKTIQFLLGDYGSETSFAIFLDDASQVRVKEAFGHLKGKRLTLAAECERNKTFNEATIKSHTGGNTRQAAVIHGARFEYEPSDKLVLITNHLPHVKDTTTAFWDRVMVIPFNRQYLGDNRDTGLRDKLQLEASGILNWIIEGAHRYINGTSKLHDRPKAVIEATTAYELNTDDLKRFIHDHMEKDPSGKIGRQELYDAYLAWFNTQDNHIAAEPCALKYFKERMGKRGVRSKDTNSGGFFMGHRLKGQSKIGTEDHYNKWLEDQKRSTNQPITPF